MTLREGPEFVLRRGHGPRNGQLLTVTPASSQPERHTTEQLEREFKLATRLDSSWAVRPLAFERQNGRATLVLEDAGGEVLDRLLVRPLTITTFFHLATGIAAALHGAHQAGLVHRNVKPENLLVCSDGSVRLTGFGLAMHASVPSIALRPGAIVGTLSHMAPEQTGRTGQSVDSRGDLYSVGITLYEMLTGILPFSATDPIGWIHCHTARAPPAPSKLINNLPPQVDSIILRLLAKSPSERYQTAAGLQADLQECLDALTTRGFISPFLIGGRDVPDRLRIPDKLYGRGAEIRSLGAAFERVATFGTPELFVVMGAPGTGKSALVAELHKSIGRSQGLYAAGKFDQFDRKTPYATLAHAITSLVHQILGDSDAELDRWRQALLEALGPTGSLMLELIPDLVLVVGEQPKARLAKPQDARLRFYQAFKRMITVFARPERPLALFLDDLHWLDQATLELLERLVSEPDLSNLLLVCAFRDTEVSNEHPLALMFDRISRLKMRMQKVTLGPLVLNDYVQLLIDMLRANQIEISQLAELLIERTGGNPFFVLQLLTALADEQLLSFDGAASCWRWEIEKIRQLGLTQNVAELMADKLTRLAPTSLNVLKTLACLGTQPTAVALAACSALNDAEVAIALEEASLAGLISIQSDKCMFTHDRVQEAAYALIPMDRRAAMHLAIGRALASQSRSLRLVEEQIFEIVNQTTVARPRSRYRGSGRKLLRST
ncbi:ATP-binding protein [Variovorax sp. GT1P44]|uniref:ATP-binding protein n=1 Tax=Variovorax sp. GT1P44 TaxID=3443742 RepID=UPI003F45BDA7